MPDTFFAPAARTAPELLAAQRDELRALSAFCVSIDAIPTLVLVINAERQIVVANRRVFEALGVTPDEVLGRRPGELVHCLGASEGPDGCGTAERCRLCGAVNTVMNSIATHQQASGDCRIPLADRCTTLDLEVVATPFAVAGRAYTIISLRDIAAEKRCEMLERLFFHDIINTAGNINGLARIMIDLGTTESDLRLLVRASNQLMEELHSHRDLLEAERGTLIPEAKDVHLDELLGEIRDAYLHHDVAIGRQIRLAPVPDIMVHSDAVLLRRVVGNLVKNAIEATPTGGTVTLDLRADGADAIITVHNQGVVPPEIRQQIFQRSFSTKGKGRGLGTYGSRLLVERYLGGTLTFTSAEGLGTVASVGIPAIPPATAVRPASALQSS